MLIEFAHAATVINPTGPGIIAGNTYQLEDVIRVSIALIVLVSGLLSVFFIVWGGVMLILSGGKEDKVKPATNSIRYSVIGLIVIILSLFVAPKIGDLLGLNVSSYVSPNVVFTTIKELSGKIFGNKDDINFDNSGGGSNTLPSDFSNL